MTSWKPWRQQGRGKAGVRLTLSPPGELWRRRVGAADAAESLQRCDQQFNNVAQDSTQANAQCTFYAAQVTLWERRRRQARCKATSRRLPGCRRSQSWLRCSSPVLTTAGRWRTPRCGASPTTVAAVPHGAVLLLEPAMGMCAADQALSGRSLASCCCSARAANIPSNLKRCCPQSVLSLPAPQHAGTGLERFLLHKP